MLADRVRMGSGGKKDIVLYDKGKIYAEYGRTKNFSNSSGVGTITFNNDHFHIYSLGSTGAFTVRSMVGFKLPPNLPTNAKIRVKYFDCDLFYVSLASSIDYLNSQESMSLSRLQFLGGSHKGTRGTGERIIELGDTTGYEVVGVTSQAFKEAINIRVEKLEVII